MTERKPITALLSEASENLYALDAADTVALLRAAWRGFCVAGAAGELLAICGDPHTSPPLWENAQPVLFTAVQVLESAPSLKARMSTEINPAGGPDDRLNQQDAGEIHRGILDLVLALNTVLPKAALAARRPAARRVCEQGTLLAHELGKCYEGRLISFLKPYRQSFGPGPARGQGKKTKKRR